ncbi:Negative regulator of sexual conjugation and meiosis [Trametes pubescens]|uniref:Negative regulator of sexual conjugation and meiosis n=1 Tax=Trametes pubescens TaxID=154538 RepID=A0A1M2W8D9_TRAPU|nr:Negative regulator of sexual conjugation and meiosis [Trametes pubescens]
MSPATSTMPDFAGIIIDERYQLLKVLGSGTYGVVYQALDFHPSADPALPYKAVKIVSKIGRQKSQLAGVRREIALQSVVSPHPNVVGLHDAFEDDEFFYIILQFYPGGDLFDHICDKRTYVYNDALLRSAFVSLVDAVQACHDAKIYHRDLKPENVLTNRDGSEVYLADFGLATDRTIVNEFGCGTTIYMSPECVGREFGYKPFCARFSDVWSLGVILINMISGRHPWAKATLEDECFVNFCQDPDFLLDMLPISEGANAILQRVLALNPLQRISLPELRAEILALDTFFMSEEELAEANEYAQIAAAGLKQEVHRSQNDASEERATAASGTGPFVEMDIGDVVRPCSPSPAAKSTSTASEVDIAELPEKGVRDHSSGSAFDSAASSRASSTDSSAVVTPGDVTPLRVAECEEKDIGECMWEKQAADAEYLISRLSLHL